MEIVNRYDSSEAEYENELPLDGISIQGFYEKPEEFDSYATQIWRVRMKRAVGPLFCLLGEC